MEYIVPIVEQVVNTLNTVRVGKINVDEEQEFAQAFRVMSIPSLVVIKNGKVEKKAVGVQSKQALYPCFNKSIKGRAFSIWFFHIDEKR